MPVLSLRVWHGMRFGDVMRLLVDGRMQLSRGRVHVAWSLVWVGAINSVLSLVQRARFGRRIATTPLVGPPIFIVGHWRAGTTLLHELMSLDARFTSPTMFEVASPYHFLVSRRLLVPIGRRLLPGRRPMDNMPLGLDLPQEDEFALLAMGLPSPYRTIAFPNRGLRDAEYLDFVGVSESERTRWMQGLAWFLQAVTARRPARLVLKSPPHLGRLPVLLKMYPDARFIHIVRDPHAVFPSTVRLWHSLQDAQALQDPTGEGIEARVFELFERLYRSFEAARPSVDPAHLAEVRYEDLVRDPVGELGRVYDALGIDDFGQVRGRVESYFAERRDYRAHEYPPDAALDAEIDRRWGPFMRAYGYCQATAGSSEARA